MLFNVTSLNYVSTGNMERMINIDLSSSDGILSNLTYLLNIEDEDTDFTAHNNNNKFSCKDVTNNELIHNLYDIKDVCLKSNIVKVKDTGHIEGNKSDKFVDIYAPHSSENPIQFVQLQDTVYVLSERTIKGPNFLKTDLLDLRNSIAPGEIKNKEYKLKISGDDLNTYIYQSPIDINISANYQARTNLRNIGYNYIYEIPHNANDFNDYDEGDIQTEILLTKNSYDNLYKMNMQLSTQLNNTRCYEGIGVCGDRVFLKYRDNINYHGLPYEPSLTNTPKDQTMTESIGNKTYQKIETIDSINRFRSNTKHKSNLFSIALRNTGLNPETNNPELNTKIIKILNDIKNNIREMVKRVCPVESLLFDVYFEGD